MDELQRSLLQRNRLRLVTQLQVSDLWDLLLQKGLFSQDMIEDIRRAGTRRDQARQLVIDLQTRGSLAFPLFVECLEETGQTELAELLREGCRKQKLDPIHIRPIEMLMPAPKHDMMSKKELPYQSASTQLRETQRIKEAKGAGDVIEGNNRKNSDKVYILEADPCGFCLIINNVIFEEHTDLSPRNGSNIDCQKLRNRFTAFHFEVLIRENLTGKEIHKELQTLAAMDHSQLDCCVVVILSHGCEVDGTGAFRWTQQHQTSAIRVQLYRVMLPHLVRTQEAKISPMQLPASRLQVMSWCPIQHFPVLYRGGITTLEHGMWKPWILSLLRMQTPRTYRLSLSWSPMQWHQKGPTSKYQDTSTSCANVFSLTQHEAGFTLCQCPRRKFQNGFRCAVFLFTCHRCIDTGKRQRTVTIYSLQICVTPESLQTMYGNSFKYSKPCFHTFNVCKMR
ncbi:caspase-9 isoform X2 [Pleurodeles waltl]|uniref:caspase-9 isoform X2 n=1 Tax=Pleurodeles waltl TaxID=8319 RepID=UPI003709AC85